MEAGTLSKNIHASACSSSLDQILAMLENLQGAKDNCCHQMTSWSTLQMESTNPKIVNLETTQQTATRQKLFIHFHSLH